ncbi:MAG: hypothetical protein J6K61_05910 [Clostridia bacterium]|nr:hypothetical protein [Clostridia bacterium]
MKLQFLGTAAAEGIPALFCECDTCKEAMRRGGKNLRTRSQAIVDDCLLIDFPADTYAHYVAYRFPMEKITSCIITHSHLDHLYAPEICVRKKGFSHLKDQKPLTFFADRSSYDMLNEEIETCRVPEETAKTVLISPYVPFETEGYTITAIRASHDPKSTPVVYLIEKEGKVMFYVNDTSDFDEEGWTYLAQYGKKIDLVSYDCTEANSHIEYVGHMCLERCVAMREKMKSLGLVDDNTIGVLNHFSHNGDSVLYEEFSEIAAKEGFLVSYDGMIINF